MGKRATASARPIVLAAGGVALAVLVAGCSGSSTNGIKLVSPIADSTGSPSPTPSSLASQSPTPSAEQLAQQQVLAVYRAYWAVNTTVFHAGSAAQRTALLEQVAAEPELSDIRNNTAGELQRGRTSWGNGDIPLKQTVVLAGSRATVTGCLDESRGGLADVATGHKLTVGVARNPVVITLTHLPIGWRVTFHHFGGDGCR